MRGLSVSDFTPADTRCWWRESAGESSLELACEAGGGLGRLIFPLCGRGGWREGGWREGGGWGVDDSDQLQSIWGRLPSGFFLVGVGEQVVEAVEVIMTAGDADEGADDHADHFVEEAIAFEGEGD